MTRAFQKIYTRIDNITKATVTLRAAGVGNDELATVGGRLAQVVKISGEEVTLQVFAGTEGVATDDEVYVHHNPNCQALLDAADTYIAPLQEAGIAVYLSVLGNHDASGVAQLSTEGARMLAKDIAQTLERYDLDGVCFDDEYSKAPDLTNPLFADRSAEAGSRLLYETKKLIGDKKVLIYEYGMLYAAGLTEIDGTAPSQFVDIIVPDYTKTSHPIEGMTNADCAGYAVELNLGRGHGAATVEQAQRIKAEGYGWYMWFGLDPMARESVYASNLTALNDVCIGLYDRELAVPTHFYKKTSEGVYDSTRYAF